MIDSEYWDEDEYNFFNHLDDDDKLLYIYDLIINDFKDDYYADTQIESDILVIFDSSKYVSITGESEEIVNTIANRMVMDGLVISQKTITTLDNGKCVLSYKIVANASPISIN